MQMYGVFDGFPLQWCIVWVGNIMTPVWAKLPGGGFKLFFSPSSPEPWGRFPC